VIAIDAPGAAPAEVVSKPATAPSRTAAGTVPLLQDLPDSLRRQIPALNISGSIYSDSPAEWTLIVNDQVLAKGGQVAPELRLEEIGPSSAVFNFRGQRFRMER
jgi:general secretion pathway protein B